MEQGGQLGGYYNHPGEQSWRFRRGSNKGSDSGYMFSVCTPNPHASILHVICVRGICPLTRSHTFPIHVVGTGCYTEGREAGKMMGLLSASQEPHYLQKLLGFARSAAFMT